MNQITNTAATRHNAYQQAEYRRHPAHRSNFRSSREDTFRIPRGASAIPTAATTHESERAYEPRTTRRDFNNSGNRNSRNKRPVPRNERKSGDGKRKMLIALVVAALVLAGIGAWQCSQPSSIDEVTGGWFYDQESTAIQEAIDHEVQDGYFNMSINTSVPVSEGTALIGIKNIPDNKFDCIVTVTLEDGTEIYKSGGLAPGSELNQVTLNQVLPSGNHQATALFEIYEQDEAHTKVGQTASKLTLHVQ